MTVIEITADQLQPGDTIITARGIGLDVLRRRITDICVSGTVSARCQGPDGQANSVVLPGRRTVIVDRPPAPLQPDTTNWWDDRDEIVALLHWLDGRGELPAVDEILLLVEKPWRWSQEREQMVSAERAAA